jgi:hypothetical protein
VRMVLTGAQDFRHCLVRCSTSEVRGLWRKADLDTDERNACVGGTVLTVRAFGSDDAPFIGAPPTPSGVFTEPTAHLLVWNRGPSGDSALLTGSIGIRNGCVGVDGGGDLIYLLWPQGSGLVSLDGGLQIVEASGDTVASVGDTISMGGGIGFLNNAETAVPGGIPAIVPGARRALLVRGRDHLRESRKSDHRGWITRQLGSRA